MPYVASPASRSKPIDELLLRQSDLVKNTMLSKGHFGPVYDGAFALTRLSNFDRIRIRICTVVLRSSAENIGARRSLTSRERKREREREKERKRERKRIEKERDKERTKEKEKEGKEKEGKERERERERKRKEKEREKERKR